MQLARSRVLCLFLLLFCLPGCGSVGVQPAPAPTHVSITSIPTLSPSPTSVVESYLPNNHDPFQANFIERAPVTECPNSSRPVDLCFNVSGSGTSIPYGSISFTSFDINYLVPGQPSLEHANDPSYCEPTTRQGNIVISGNTIHFTASGNWCWTLVHFAYPVTGGTGAFQHAHGTGNIYIPNRTQSVLEYWTGTLSP